MYRYQLEKKAEKVVFRGEWAKWRNGLRRSDGRYSETAIVGEQNGCTRIQI